MKNKDLKKLLDMSKELSEMVDDDNDHVFKSFIEKGHQEEATISIHKHADGRAETRIEGSTPAIMITLAALEKCVLEKSDVPVGMFEIVKTTLDTKEIRDEEE